MLGAKPDNRTPDPYSRPAAVATVRGPQRLWSEPPKPAVIPTTARVTLKVRPTSPRVAPCSSAKGSSRTLQA